jgi:hypothetical protein
LNGRFSISAIGKSRMSSMCVGAARHRHRNFWEAQCKYSINRKHKSLSFLYFYKASHSLSKRLEAWFFKWINQACKDKYEECIYLSNWDIGTRLKVFLIREQDKTPWVIKPENCGYTVKNQRPSRGNQVKRRWRIRPPK